MTNDRLRDALSKKGLTPSDLASQLGIDPKTASRWVTTGRTPYSKHRHQVAALVHESEAYLWPDARSEAQRDRAAESEIVRVYPRRTAVPPELWSRLFNDTTAYLDVLVYAGLFLPEQYPEIVKSLCDKASDGVRIRVLLGDPDSDAVAVRGDEEGIGAAVAAKVRNVMTFYKPHVKDGCTTIRTHATTLYSSTYRFDDEMLVNNHIYGRPAAQAPLMHLRRLSAGDLFDTYMDTFERIWSDAKPWPEDT